MNETDNIRSMMERFGREVQILFSDGGSSIPFKVFLQPLRYKNKMYLGGVNTRIGFNREGYYLYLGPPEHDITVFNKDVRLLCGEEEYSIDRAEVVYFGDEPSHIWAIIRKMEE